MTKIDLTISQPKAEATRTDENSRAKGKRILERAQAAVGGAEKLAAIKDTMQISDYKLSAAAGGRQLTETDRWIAPSYFRQESQFPKQGRIVAFFDGKTGRIGAPEVSRSARRTAVKAGTRRSVPFVYSAHAQRPDRRTNRECG